MYKITKDDIDFCDRYIRRLCGRCGRPACDDAIQSGREGLVIAAHKFDPSRNDSFKGFATWQIRHELYRNHFGYRKKSDALKKSVAYNDDICYMNNSGESKIVNKLTARALLDELTDEERFVAIQMGILGKSSVELATANQKTHQTFDKRFKRVRRIIRKRYGKELNHGKV